MYPGCHPWRGFLFVLVLASTRLTPQRGEHSAWPNEYSQILEMETLPSQPRALLALYRARAHLCSPFSPQLVLPD